MCSMVYYFREGVTGCVAFEQPCLFCWYRYNIMVFHTGFSHSAQSLSCNRGARECSHLLIHHSCNSQLFVLLNKTVLFDNLLEKRKMERLKCVFVSEVGSQSFAFLS